MKDLAFLGVETAKRQGAAYADVRIIAGQAEQLATKNGQVSGLHKSDSLGYGIRALVRGAWGFAASNQMSKAAMQTTAARAVRLARAGAQARARPRPWAPEPTAQASWRTPCLIDPFKVSLQAKFNLLLAIDKILRQNRKVAVAQTSMDFEAEQQWFANTEGAFVEQYLLQSGGGYACTSVGSGDTQYRSYPAAGGQYAGMGYELILGLELLENAERVREEAVALLTAKPLPPGKRDLILHGNQLHLQIHESVGHATELDRVLGLEANAAGGSFATVEKKGAFRYGAPIVNLVADSTVPTGLGTLGWDDDGVAAQRWPIVQDGILQGYATNRELAHVIGEHRSRGCSRADSYQHIPLTRIPNLSLMPGAWEYDDLLADSDGAILFDNNKSWSIDQQRLNFQFGTEIAWEIKGGRKRTFYKNPTYQGLTPQFWNSCDAICNQKSWQLWGINDCLKGQPGQRAQMSHGSAPARFRQVTVGVGNA